MVDYFFSGDKYIRVTRGNTGPGTIDPGYPAPISNWEWDAFGANGIDAALYSGVKCYFFAGNQYIQVSRDVLWPGKIDPGFPRPIADWGWGSFGVNGIDAALNSGAKSYFFLGDKYIRVTRGEVGVGTVDAGYPAPIAEWGWGAFGATGVDAALYSGSKCYFFSKQQYFRVSRGDLWPGLLDPGYPAPISNWGWGAFGANGIDAALYSGGPLVPPPPYPRGLGSCSNYFLACNCKPVMDASVVINADTDIIGDNGFSFQLNCDPPSNTACGWQQYCIILDPKTNQLFGKVDNWTATNPSTQLLNVDVPLLQMPSLKLPASYQLSISLVNDANGNITGVTFGVIDNHGTAINKTISLVGQGRYGGGIPITAADLSPISDLTLNFVGPYNSQNTNITAGVGTMTFTASGQMNVLDDKPNCIQEPTVFTAEVSNTRFGQLPSTASNTFTQSFQFQPAGPGAIIHQTRPGARALAWNRP
jgi:hypothetical protein